MSDSKSFPSDRALQVMLYAPEMREAWESLVGQSAQGWLFHGRSFIGFSSKAFGLQEMSLTAWKEGMLVGILPLSYHAAALPDKRKMGSLAFSPAGPALSPCLNSKESTQIIDSLMEHANRLARQERCKCLEVSLPALAPAQLANARGVSPLDHMGFAPTSTSTYIIDLSPDEEHLYAAMRKQQVQHQIRKAERAGVNIVQAGPDSLDEYYRIHCDTYERTGAHPHPRAYFEGIFYELIPAGHARVLAANLNGKTIGFANIALFKESALYWTGCSTQEALDAGANYLLQWRAIQLARQSGAKYYEVGEAFPGSRGDKLAGLNAFKSAFGGERWPFHKGRLQILPDRKPSRARLALYYLKKSMEALFKG